MYIQHLGALRNHGCCGKGISITYSECVLLALLTQHAKRMRRFILSPVVSLNTIFFHISHKTEGFWEKNC
jgi:hypothetical protein